MNPTLIYFFVTILIISLLFFLIKGKEKYYLGEYDKVKQCRCKMII